MGAGSAIQAGQAFVKFYGEMSDLQQSFRQIETQVNKIAVSTKNSFGTTFTDSTNRAAASVTGANRVVVDFGASVAVSLRSVLGFASNLSNLSRTASIASWGLRGASIVMKMMGKDASKLEPWISGLNRASWAIFGINAASKVARASWSAFLAVAKSPITIPMAAARGLGRLIPRGGGAATGAAVSHIVSGASSTSEDDQHSTSSAVSSGALSGLMMGGIVGAASGAAFAGIGSMISKAMTDGAKAGAAESDSIITRFGNKINAIFQWIGKHAGDIWSHITESVKSFGGKGESILTRLEKAIYPIIYAVENVWVPAMKSGIDYIVGMFSSGRQNMESTWSDFFVNAIGTVADFIGNFDLYFQIAQQTIAMWTGNAIVMVQDFFKNFGKLIEWLGSNWQNVLFTMLDFALTVFINMGENIRTLFAKIWAWVKSGFTESLNLKPEDFKGLTDGFHSSVSQLPKIFDSELAKSTPELESLYDRLEQRQADAKAKLEEFKGLSYEANESKKGKSSDRGFSAISAQSQDAAEIIARATGTKKDETPKKIDQTNKNLVTIEKTLKTGFDKISTGGVTQTYGIPK